MPAAPQTLPSVKVPTPLVELPLGATEDRICGTIDIEAALKEGVKAFEPGLLAKANRGILYVDEVNLLEDSLVDLVLDSAAGGVNTVEREGVSVVHPAKFIMIGSGNPGEGELRPQLLDRFGCCVKVATIMDTDQRVELVMNRISYEQDPYAFNEGCKVTARFVQRGVLRRSAASWQGNADGATRARRRRRRGSVGRLSTPAGGSRRSRWGAT